MVQSNKVLTVSYGTFSCTLEGFEDSFGTMKAIAEYFRDLAADDRYFGAEPPQPDADLLARIAQREISRRVEAHTDGNAVVLTAQAGATPDQATEAASQPPAQTADNAGDTGAPADHAERTQTDTDSVAAQDVEILDPEPQAAPAAHAASAGAADSIAQKLQRIRDVVARDSSFAPTGSDSLSALDPDMADLSAAFEEDEDDVAATAEDSTDRNLSEVMRTATAEAAPEVPEVETGPDEAAADTAPDPEPAPPVPEDMTGAEPDAALAPDMDSADADTADADDAVAAVADAMARTGQDQPDDMAGDTAAEDTAAEVQPHMADDTAPPPFDLSAFQAAVADADDHPGTDEPADEAPATSEPMGDDTIFSHLDDELDEPEDVFADGDDDDDDLSNILADPDGGDAPAAAHMGRVIKVKKSDLEAALARGALEEIPEDDDQPETDDQPEGRPTTSLTPEEEAELLQELSEISAEVRGNTPTSGAPTGQIQPDAAMPRLMTKAGEKMAEEESATNRETYAQMRAAVAVTRAEEEADTSPRLLAPDEKYREDLDTVVRPDRPMTRTSTRARPETRTAAPLKLVAEQRVDTQDEAAETPAPVQPRRVTTAMLDGDAPKHQDTDSFETFAKEAGAHTLHELLEAAAAYLSYVEGREKFSRPQLMTKVRQVEKDDFNREDGLRSFGQLLREGKISKVGGGRFTASPDIGFRPEDRVAG